MNPIVEELLPLLNEDQLDSFFERVSICEFDGGMSRDHAECFALLCVLRKHPRLTSQNKRDLIGIL